MATTLKSFFGRAVVEEIATAVARVHPPFRRESFVEDALRGLSRLELLARGVHVAGALRRHLPADYQEAIEVLVASMGPEIAANDISGQGMTPFLYLPHVAFIRDHGVDHFDASMRANHEVTRRFTAEWSIRPFLQHHPERTFALLRRWARDPSVHVRRLVSEGTRPRLPWATQVPGLRADPGPGLALLELLKDDPEEYVRRSVANHLNDVAKDHPDLVVETCRRWLEGAGTETPRARMVKHALRSLVKRGHPGALGLLGHGERPRIAVRSATVSPARVLIGGKAAFRAEVVSTVRRRKLLPGHAAGVGPVELRSTGGGRRAPRELSAPSPPGSQSLSVDLAVHFVKKDGAARAKMMKGRTLMLAPGASATVAKTISFALHTTRTPNPGPHAVDLVVNGVRYPGARFTVVAAKGPVRPARRGRAPVSRRAR